MLQLLAYATAIAMQDLSHICDLYHSSGQCQILKPLSKARDRTCILMDTSRVLFPGLSRFTGHFLGPDRVSAATPAYPNSSATSQARNSPRTPRPEPSHEPFDFFRDQVRREGINPFTSLGIGNCCFTVMLFSGLKLIHMRHLPSFFLASTGLCPNALVDSWALPFYSNSSTWRSISSSC